MTSDQLASMYAEIVRGTPKTQSRFANDPEFNPLWDKITAEVASIRKSNPAARFDIPNEVAG